MSGIAGIWARDGKPVKDTAAQMLDTLAHRGRDGANLWCEGELGLGHLMMLSTPQAPGETLPMAAHHVVLTADMRLDNRDELQRALGLQHEPLGKLGDSQLLLAAYGKWGEDCPHHLLGDFAFAIWDAQQRRLFCARDHMGIKPFYYYASSRVFIFASEIKALWREPEVPREADELRVGYHLIFRDEPARTFYRDIRRLPPGHALSVTREREYLTRYWALDPDYRLPKMSDAAYAEQFEALFTDAVRCRVRTSHPVGSILSGGMDSSSITCVAHHVMAEHGGEALHTFSARFTEDGNTDEQPYIDAVVERLRAHAGGPEVIPHTLDGNTFNPAPDVLKRIMWHQEEPFWYAFLLVLWPLYEMAQQQGVRVLLDGTDGDSVIDYNRSTYFAELLRTGRWTSFATEIGAMARVTGATGWRLPLRGLRQSWRFGFKPLMVRPWRSRLKRWRQEWRRPLNRDWAHEINLMPHFRPRGVYGFPPFGTHHERHYGNLTHRAFPYHLEMLNRSAAAFGLEYRHPFFDKRLVEFCLALPAEQKFSRGLTRPVMRRGLKSMLPAKLYHRPDKGLLFHPYQYHVLTHGAPPLRDMVMNQVDGLWRYVDQTALRHVYHDYYNQGNMHYCGEVWSITTLALWLHGINTQCDDRVEA